MTATAAAAPCSSSGPAARPAGRSRAPSPPGGVPVRAAVRRRGGPPPRCSPPGRHEAVAVDLGTGQGLAERAHGRGGRLPPGAQRAPRRGRHGRAGLRRGRARQAVGRRLVFHSVLHPDDASMPHHARKARAEDVVRGTRLPWTVLSPRGVPPEACSARALPAGITVPYDLDAPFTNVDLDDVRRGRRPQALTGALPAHRGARRRARRARVRSACAPWPQVAHRVLAPPRSTRRAGHARGLGTGPPRALAGPGRGRTSPRCSAAYDAARPVRRGPTCRQPGCYGRTAHQLGAACCAEADTSHPRNRDRTTNAGMKGPLDGIAVIDLSRALAGPHAGDDAGRPRRPRHQGRDARHAVTTPAAGGRRSSARRTTRESTYFLSCNRNKESIALDLKSDDGRSVLTALVTPRRRPAGELPPRRAGPARLLRGAAARAQPAPGRPVDHRVRPRRPRGRPRRATTRSPRARRG